MNHADRLLGDHLVIRSRRSEVVGATLAALRSTMPDVDSGAERRPRQVNDDVAFLVDTLAVGVRVDDPSLVAGFLAWSVAQGHFTAAQAHAVTAALATALPTELHDARALLLSATDGIDAQH